MLPVLRERFFQCIDDLPFLSPPAVHPHQYALCEDKILTRAITGTVLFILAMTACEAIPHAALFVVGFEFLALISVGFVVACLISAFEANQAIQSLNQRAVEEYKNQSIPSAAALAYIATSPRAFNALLKEGQDFQKKGTDQSTLVEKICSKEGSSIAFHMLIEGGFFEQFPIDKQFIEKMDPSKKRYIAVPVIVKNYYHIHRSPKN